MVPEGPKHSSDEPAVFEIGRGAFRGHAQLDAYRTLIRILFHLARDEEEVWSQAELLAASVEEHGDEVRAAEAAGMALNADILVALLLAYVRHRAWQGVLRLTAIVDPSGLPGDGGGSELYWIWACASALAWLEEMDDPPNDKPWSAPGAAVAYRQLAEFEFGAGNQEVALAAALSSVNLSGESSETRACVDLALRLAGEVEDPVVSLALKARQAIALAKTCRSDPSVVPVAFDACESAIRHAAWAGETGQHELEALLVAVADEEQLRGLGPLGTGATNSDLSGHEYGSSLRAFSQICWEASLEEMQPLLEGIYHIAVMHEDQRLALSPEPHNPAAAEASWTTWSFEHPMFRRAVPHGLSFQRTSGAAETFLILVHETIHVLSMTGALGVAVTSLRLALLEVEWRLWGFAGPTAFETVERLGIAPIIPGSLAALPQVEQALELSQKLRAIQEVWSPWFEGLALFGELAATSPEDPFNSTVTQVIANLIEDEPLEQSAAERGLTVPEEILRRQRQADEAFARAGESLESARLRYILQQHPSKYLAGYLTVRGLVSAWRNATGGDLDLPAAFRLLIHITRHGTLDAIPDLALPADAFRAQAVDRLRSWIQHAAGIDPTTFEAFGSPDKAKELIWRQVDGRLVAESADMQPVEWRPMVERALLTLTGQYSKRERVPDPDPTSLALIDAGAESLKLQSWSLIEQLPDLPNRLLGRVRVLPIGRCYTPFWLTSDDYLVSLIRVVDGHSTENNTRHQLTASQLTPEVASELRDEMRKRRDSRMSVVRIADLADQRHVPEFRGGGSNYLAFVYGSWIHIEARGMLLGARTPVASSLIADVTARLLPNQLLELESIHTAGGRTGAERTLRWLAESHEWSLEGEASDAEGNSYDPAAFVAHLVDMANDLQNPDRETAVNAAGAGMLSLLVPANIAVSLQREGLRPVRAVQHQYLRELLAVLATTALGRTGSQFLDQHWSSLEPLVGPLFTHTPQGWDVSPISLEEVP